MSAAGLATFGGGITSTAVANTLGATSFNDANITNVGNIALDSITADGSTITITGNTTFADGAYNFNIASHDGSNGLQLGGTLVTATAAELNIIDGGTSASSTTVADADRVVFNDDGTMKQVAVTDLAAYFDDEITAMPNLVTTAATTVGALNSGSITSGFGTIDTGSSTITTTGLISGGSLDIDDVLINGTTIGHTDDTDLITLADGVVTVAGEISVTTLDIGGTNVTATAAELNILDGVTATASELNIMDGVTATTAELNIMDGVTSTAGELNLLDGSAKSTSSITIADADAFIVIDGTTTKQIPASDIATYATGSTGQLSTGTENVAIGGSALANITSDAVRNVAFGQEAGNDITSGDLNVAVGYQALQSATTDQQHVAVGLGALNSTNEATSGDGHNGNVGIGSYAGYTNVTGRFQTFVGTHSGKYIIGGYNTSVGHQALQGVSGSTTSDVQQCVAVGYNSMSAITTGDSNTAVGASAGSKITTGHYNVLIGQEAHGPTTGNNNVGIGRGVLSSSLTSGADNIAIGYEAMRYASASDNIAIGRFAAGGSSSTANTGSANVAIGYEAGKFATGAANVSIGYESLKGNTSGSAAEHNTAIGAYTLNVATTAESNTVVGHSAGGSVTTGDNNLLLGHDAGKSGSPGGAVSTGSNEIALGDENITECNIQVDWTVASDERDKTDFTALDVGLSFVNSLKPYTYKWDKRIKYVDKTKEDWDKDLDLNTITHDGTHKEDWLDIGFKAQEVEALEKDAGYKISDKTNLTTSLSGDGKQYGIKYSNFVPILVKALQELSAKNDALEARIKTLEG